MNKTSEQTRQARGRLDGAERDLRAHQRDCPACLKALNRRRPAEACTAGQHLRGLVADAKVTLAARRAIDMAPAVEQGTLFDNEILSAK